MLFSNFKSILFKIEYLTCLLLKINVSLRRHKDGRQYNFQRDKAEFRAQWKKLRELGGIKHSDIVGKNKKKRRKDSQGQPKAYGTSWVLSQFDS